ncbi:hypothetical protein M758_6G003300 [Ceratodon purpureus]|nr:hypothetical protein M758_6G003300 [Ceratodon purpureus]
MCSRLTPRTPITFFTKSTHLTYLTSTANHQNYTNWRISKQAFRNLLVGYHSGNRLRRTVLSNYSHPCPRKRVQNPHTQWTRLIDTLAQIRHHSFIPFMIIQIGKIDVSGI